MEIILCCGHFSTSRKYLIHIIMSYINKNFPPSDIQVIPTTSEKYISFQSGSLRFLDSLQFLNASLESLVQRLVKDGVNKFQHTQRQSPGSDLVFQKGIYCYEYMDSRDKFKMTNLPPRNNCIAILRKKVPAKMITRMLKRYGMNSASKIDASTTTCI